MVAGRLEGMFPAAQLAEGAITVAVVAVQPTVAAADTTSAGSL